MPRRKKDDASLFYDMLAASRLVVSFTEGKNWSDYERDVLLRSAVERQIGIVGEAAWKMSVETKAKYPDVPWEKIAPARHRLIHDYDLIDDAIVWSIATKYIPELIPQIEAMMPPIPDQDSEASL